MNRPIVCVDVDGTLFNLKGEVNDKIVNVIKALSQFCNVYVWSGGGRYYAEQRAREAKVTEYIVEAISKMEVDRIGRPDITLDDEGYLFSKVNILV